MIIIHCVAPAVYDGKTRNDSTLAHIQTARCGAKLPRHRKGIPSIAERDAHYWVGLKDFGQSMSKTNAHSGKVVARCPKCVDTTAK